MKTLIAAMMLSGSVQASDYDYMSMYSHTNSSAESKSFSRSQSTAISGGNTQSVSVTDSGNTQSVSVTDSGKMHYSGGYELENVPDVMAPNVYPTSPCMGSSSIGGAGVGFGISFGTSWESEECQLRETSRSFANMGMKEDAIAILCTSEYAKNAPSCKGK